MREVDVTEASNTRPVHNPAVKIRIPTPPLETPVSKSPDRRVICRAGVQRRWPLRVPGPVLATSYDEALPVALSVIDSCATHLGRPSSATEADFRPRLSPISLSRAARVIGCCERLNRSQPFRNLPPTRLVFPERRQRPRPVDGHHAHRYALGVPPEPRRPELAQFLRRRPHATYNTSCMHADGSRDASSMGRLATLLSRTGRT